MNDSELIDYITNLNNWVPQRDIPKVYPQYTHSQIKILFWKREEHPGLSRCMKMVGKRMYINVPMFGLWMAGKISD